MKIIRIFLLLIVFFVPVAGMITTPSNLVLKGENRNITAFPEFGKAHFFSNLQKYVTDRIFYKVKFEEAIFPVFKEYFSFFKFDKSEISIAGNDGWLFFSDNYVSKVYQQHSFLLNNTEFRNSIFKTKIPYLKVVSNLSNAKFYFVVGPDKHGIYPEFMDQHYGKPGQYRLFSDFRNVLESNGFEVIDPYNAIRAYKGKLGYRSLYYTDDSHWNLAGAKVAFDYLMQNIVNDYIPFDYEFAYFKHKNGDLVRNIKQPKNEYLDDVKVTRKGLPFVEVIDLNSNKLISKEKLNFELPEYGTLVVNEQAVDKRTVLLLSDSYGYALKSYLSDYFYKVAHCYGFVQNPYQLKQIIDKTKPDLVLFVNVERKFFTL